MQLNEANFTTLFGSTAALFLAPQPDSFGNPIIFWKGNLSLPDTLVNAGVSGLWFDWDALSTPILADHPKADGVGLAQGSQSVGNSGPVFGEYPNAIAEAYNFPLSSSALWTSVPTGPVGLIEPAIGTEPNPGPAFQDCSTPIARPRELPHRRQ